MEIDFCRPKVIHGLFLNFSFCLEILFRRAYRSKIELNLFRKLTEDSLTFRWSDFITFPQSTDT